MPKNPSMTLPATMRVVEITQIGGPEVLKAGTRPLQLPSMGEVLIKVAAAGVNRADTMQRTGKYPMPPGAPDIMGLEVSGTIVALGLGVTEWQLGDEVCALVAGGGYADYCVAPAQNCMTIPKGVSLRPDFEASCVKTIGRITNCPASRRMHVSEPMAASSSPSWKTASTAATRCNPSKMRSTTSACASALATTVSAA